jgi:hypothetical protein
MKLIAEADRRRFFHIPLTAPRALSEWSAEEPFACLLWDCDGKWASEGRHTLVAALIEAGCRYFVCGGCDAPAWEEAADEAFVNVTLSLSDSEREARHVMTTSHRDESESEVAFFFVFNTNFDAHVFNRYLVLAIGCDEVLIERLCAAVRYHASTMTEQ